MASLPSGTVTFLFTDIEGSTRLWEGQGPRMRLSLARHDRILRQAIESNQGYVFKTVGDAFCASFVTATEALAAALDAQEMIGREPWEVDGGIRVRMALHTGTAEERDGDYFGPTLNRVARLLGIGYGAQVLVSLVTEELLRDNLPADTTLRDVGEHRLKDLMRPEKVYQVDKAGLRTEFPALKSLDNHPHNLPVQPTPFLGREKELAAVRELLASEAVRLLTLTGPGGTGKTRLALQAAADLSDRFEDGTFFVDLSAIDTPTWIVPAITRTLEIRETGGRAPLDMLRDFTHHRKMLIVLDNFEQIRGGEPYVVQVLSSCPSLKLLVTSREALHIRGEQVMGVPPLSFPRVRDARALERASLHQFEAVTLFIERAVSVLPVFQATNENAPAIAEICARLDGLPLAIELAAARVALLTPAEILARLGQRLRFLSGGLADLPHRQRTLRAAIDWSYRLLGPLEQTLLRELSVFAGGATIEAMEKVCACGGEDDDAVLEALSGLAAKSLVVREESAGAVRFSMLESIREYAAELLEKSGGADAIREAHARYYLAVAEREESRMRGPDQKAAFDLVEAEHDNMLAALASLESLGAASDQQRLCAALGPFWVVRGFAREGAECCSRALGRAPRRPGPVRWKATVAYAECTREIGSFDKAIEALEDALRESQELGDGSLDGRLHHDLGWTLLRQERLKDARGSFAAALETGLPGAEWLRASTVMGTGVIALLEDRPNLALGDLQHARDAFRRAGDIRGLGQAIGNLMLVEAGRGNLDDAIAGYDQTRSIYQELNDTHGLCVAYNNLGMLYLKKGRPADARAWFERLAVLAGRKGLRRLLCLALAGSADAYNAEGDAATGLEEALRALDAAAGLSDPLTRGVCHRVLGETYCLLGRNREAQGECETAIGMLQRAHDREELAQARRCYETVMTRLGEPAREDL